MPNEPLNPRPNANRPEPEVNPPENLDPLAAQILQRLAGRDAASEIVIGGYLALQHYLDYRKTRDIDAWWRSAATAEAEHMIREVMSQVAVECGFLLGERRFGDTVSFELVRDGMKEFSFQIATRSVELEPPLLSAWPPIRIETLNDNVGSKMNALVDRGAPRDFLDVMNVVTARLVSVEQCWSLWRRKNSDCPGEGARKKVRHHLESLELRRPLASIADPADRDAANRTREWYRTVFLGPSA
jgi:hypothetical protein